MATTLTSVPQQSKLLNRVKGLYVGLYLTAAMVASVYAFTQLFAESFQWGWVGVLLTTLPFMFTLTKAFIFKEMARTPAHMVGNVIWGVAGVVIALLGMLMFGGTLIPVGVAVLLLLGYVAYDYWYSDLGRQPSPVLNVGETLPDFTVYRGNGTPLQSATLRGSPALILFFRGNWCPFCVAQIREIVASYQELADRGVKTWFISPQTEKHTQDLAKQFNVPCEFLSDHNNQVAEQLGIAAEGGLPVGMEVLGYDSDTVLPTALVVDGTGKIIYSDQTTNYRVRPEPQEYLAILDAQGVS